MSEINSEDKKNAVEEVVAETPATEEVVVETEAKTEEVVTAESDTEETAPYLSTKVEEDKPASNDKYYAIAVSLALVVVLSVVTVTTFFQAEYDAVVASASSFLDEAEQVSEVAVVSNEIVAASVAQPVQGNVAPGHGYQSFANRPSQNINFDEMRQQRRASHEEAMRQHEARMAEMNQSRTANFERMEQDRVARMARFETMHEKTQAIQKEMQQKMQAAYDEFHAI